MRWLFLFLLILNAAFISWHYFHAGQDRDAVAVPHAGVDTIVLLGELETEAGAHAAGGKGDSGSVSPGPAAEAIADERVVDAAVSSESGDAVTVAGQRPAAEPRAAAAPAAGDGARSGDAVVPEASGIRYRCFTLGPFRAMEDLRAITRDIKDYVAEASFRSREEKEATRFRVYLSPSDGLEGANRLTARLREQGIRDSFIIAGGPLRHSVSLGYFSEKKRAYRHADTIRGKGFEPVVEPVFKTYTLYWLDYRIREGAEIPPEIFSDRLDRGAGRLSRSCA